MASYISLIRWTDQGIKSYGNTIDRAEAAGQLAAKVGVTMKQIYWTLGAYDLMSILEAADDESVTAFTLALSSLGNVRTTTMRAFDTAEMREIVAKHRMYI
ncbi:GYD domain-containing protein [Mycobacterium sp.]|uniref:GYD domain-containing protein n=1 Tax=Mycobacterium sp. TaxID=1785 RepID=UPI003C7207C4